jgi:MFS family permease
VFGNLYGFLIFGTFLCGVGISAIWSLSPAVMGEVFSLKHIGRNWGIALMIAALFGMLTQEIFGVTYDAHVPDGEIDCFDMKCVSGGLGFSIAAGVLSVILGTIYIIKEGRCS